MKNIIIAAAVLALYCSCVSAPKPVQYRIEGSGDPDILIVDSISFEEKSKGFQKDAIYMQLRNNTDKPIWLLSFDFIRDENRSPLIMVATPNATEQLMNDRIEPNTTIERYFYPSFYSFGGDSFSIIFNFYTVEILPTKNLYEGISELPEEERFEETMRRFMSIPEDSNIETKYSIKLDFTRIEQ
jgi:hypothetical protein